MDGVESKLALADGEVSTLLVRPAGARCLLVLGHGAGIPMRHAWMQQASEMLASRRIATFRYQFPYAEAGRRMPDRHPVLTETVRHAVVAGAQAAGDLPLLAGGKSLGGRMTSLAAADDALPAVSGLVFFGFPLHPARKPATQRAEHLERINLPMLFLQGTRDDLADIDLIGGVCDRLGDRAVLHVVEGADHSFNVLRRSGRMADEVMGELAATVEGWANKVD
jgi:predicted alpha/beta-hydrolase family hydrolase